MLVFGSEFALVTCCMGFLSCMGVVTFHIVVVPLQYDNVLMEEAAQILEIETFIPLLLQVRINFISINTNFQANDILVAQRLRRE